MSFAFLGHPRQHIQKNGPKWLIETATKSKWSSKAAILHNSFLLVALGNKSMKNSSIPVLSSKRWTSPQGTCSKGIGQSFSRTTLLSNMSSSENDSWPLLSFLYLLEVACSVVFLTRLRQNGPSKILSFSSLVGEGLGKLSSTWVASPAASVSSDGLLERTFWFKKLI